MRDYLIQINCYSITSQVFFQSSSNHNILYPVYVPTFANRFREICWSFEDLKIFLSEADTKILLKKGVSSALLFIIKIEVKLICWSNILINDIFKVNLFCLIEKIWKWYLQHVLSRLVGRTSVGRSFCPRTIESNNASRGVGARTSGANFLSAAWNYKNIFIDFVDLLLFNNSLILNIL